LIVLTCLLTCCLICYPRLHLQLDNRTSNRPSRVEWPKKTQNESILTRRLIFDQRAVGLEKRVVEADSVLRRLLSLLACASLHRSGQQSFRCQLLCHHRTNCKVNFAQEMRIKFQKAFRPANRWSGKVLSPNYGITLTIQVSQGFHADK